MNVYSTHHSLDRDTTIQTVTAPTSLALSQAEPDGEVHKLLSERNQEAGGRFGEKIGNLNRLWMLPMPVISCYVAKLN